MTLRKTGLAILVTGYTLLQSCSWEKAELPKPEPPKALCDSLQPTYVGHIAPVISANCSLSGCHNAGSSNGDWTTYAGLKTSVTSGKLKLRVIELKDMPPAGPLPQDKINLIDCWLKAGAPNN